MINDAAHTKKKKTFSGGDGHNSLLNSLKMETKHGLLMS